ncbi:MAG: hypothetical protein PGN22_02870 [Agrobacterium cavarae]
MAGYIFGGNTGLSYNELQRRREIADALSKQIMGETPKTTAQGIGALMKGIGAGIGRYSANKGIKEGTDSANSAYDSIFGRLMGGSAATGAPSVSSGGGTIPMTGAASEVAATAPTTGDTFQPFMDTIKAGGVQNPYALAAIAATGRAESGWSGKKAVSTWSDPSESGQAGTSGGIMSWRGPRYQALAATGDLSPQGQANFFLKEDPELIARLNNAKSLEEAQQLMNNAWAFAGYNRPGGESSRRLGYAKGYLSSFQGSNSGGTEVASLDPSIGMPPAVAAIERQAPTPAAGPSPAAAYRDPMVSAPNAPRGPIAPVPQPEQAQTQQPAPTPQQQQVALNGQPPMPMQAPPVPQSPFQGVDPAMIQLLNNPFLDPDKKAIIQTVVQQQMQANEAARQEQTWRSRQEYVTQQQRNDPAYKLDLDTKQAQLDVLRGKPQKTWQKLDDNTLFNPATGETMPAGTPAPTGNGQFRFQGKSVEAQALNGLMEAGQLTESEAQQLAAGKQITDPATGALIFMTPQGVFGKSADGRVAPLSGNTQQAPATTGVDIFADVPNTQNPAQPQPSAPPSATTTPAPSTPAASQQPTAAQPGMIPLTSGDGLDTKARQRQQMAKDYGLDPNSEEGKRFILTGTLPASDRGVTAGDREAIRDADDQAQASRSAIEQLQSVIAPRGENGPSLNDLAGSGALADWQSWAARNDPTGFFDDAKGEATTELSNTVLGQALGSLKSIFGAAPTEGERQILLDMQASVDKTPRERKIIIDKAIALANRKLKYYQDRATDLRQGSYYKADRGAAPNVQTNTPQTPAEAAGLPPIDGPAPNKRVRFNPATGEFE